MATNDQKAVSSSYRKTALAHYKRELDGTTFNLCVVCGFGVQEVLEVAHLDQNRKNNDVDNLAILCPNCHKMHDIGLIHGDVVRTLRDNPTKANWGLRIKDAGVKAAATKLAKSTAAKKSAAAKKAWANRSKGALSADVGE
ncbi:MAG TPA: HNH endonuclease signature motif containing protein [Noviherbaspirillum sp.]|nr:HNH endonuclease signature motif containing protein [Noviherbaspirillum sp.]